MALNMPKDSEEIHRITANIPKNLLERAQKVTDQGITETLVQGLELLCQSEAAALARQLKGKIQLPENRGGAHGSPRS